MTDQESTRLFQELSEIAWPQDCNVAYTKSRNGGDFLTVDAIGPLGEFNDVIRSYGPEESSRVRQEIVKLSMLFGGTATAAKPWHEAAMASVPYFGIHAETRKRAIGVIAAMSEIDIEKPVWTTGTERDCFKIEMYKGKKGITVLVRKNRTAVLAATSDRKSAWLSVGVSNPSCSAWDSARKGMLWLSDRAHVEVQ